MKDYHLQNPSSKMKRKKINIKQGVKSPGKSKKHRMMLHTPQEGAPGGALKQKKGTGVLEKMRQKLQGGQFRWLNEQLYTNNGDFALRLMKETPALYHQYHQGMPMYQC